MIEIRLQSTYNPRDQIGGEPMSSFTYLAPHVEPVLEGRAIGVYLPKFMRASQVRDVVATKRKCGPRYLLAEKFGGQVRRIRHGVRGP